MRGYLYFTVCVSGMVTLAAELSASRLLGAYFGESNLVWASIIGLILIYLAAGYFFGGRWADRSPHARTLYRILAWGAFSLGVIPYVAHPVLQAAARAFDQLQVGVLAGSFAAVLVLFIAPITLLGMISPFAIRISLRDTRTAGNVAGQLYALSTLGSFIGTFLPVLLLIPTLGTTRTFLISGLFLLLVALGGLSLGGEYRTAMRYLFLVAVLLALAAFGPLGLKDTPGQIYEGESAYNYIEVIERDGARYLRLNDGQGVHSMYHPDVLDYNGPWEQFLASPFFNPPPYEPERVRRIAIVGLAAGTTARQATAVYGPIPMDGFEIDPKIVEVGRRYFGMTMPNLSVHVQDGRWGLAHSPYRYTIIAVDAYRPPYIPWHMTTQEFFQIAYDHLTDDGVLAINVGRTPDDRRLINALATTIASVFPSVYVVDIPDTFNSIVYASRTPTERENLIRNFFSLSARGDVHPLLLDAMATALLNMQPSFERTTVFTDDRAPLEWITNDMVLDFVLAGSFDALR